MELEIQESKEGPLIIRKYVTEDGGQGFHCIPLEAVATRMAMLGFDSPALALDAIFREVELMEEGNNVNIYGGVYEALATHGDLAVAQAEARASLDPTLGADSRELAEFKDALCASHTAQLEAVGRVFLEQNSPKVR